VLQRQIEVGDARGADRVDEPVGEVGRVEVEQPHPVDPRRDPVDQRHDPALAPPLVAAERGEVLRHEHHLAHAGVGEAFDLGEDRLHRPAALLAPEAGDGAEPAGAVAPLGHLDVGPRPGGARPRQVEQVERRHGRRRRSGPLLASGTQRDRHAETGDRIGLGERLGQVGAVALGQAPRDHQLGRRGLSVGQREDHVDRLLAGVLDEGAGVDDDQVGVVGRGGGNEPVGEHRPGQLVRVDLVLRTAQRLHPKGAGHPRKATGTRSGVPHLECAR
jgi:hypothetical protein